MNIRITDNIATISEKRITKNCIPNLKERRKKMNMGYNLKAQYKYIACMFSVEYAVEKVANKDVTCNTPSSMFLYPLYVVICVMFLFINNNY